ncbi:MAG: biotin synthase, partial [Verrucomicrobiota bacterium]
YADRVSINVELPTKKGLTRLAPDKDEGTIEGAMDKTKARIIEAKDERKRFRHAPRFAPAGQSTQMIVGADDANDAAIVTKASGLYKGFGLRRVYYSAFSPIPDASAVLPLKRPPLMREHRLYQSDWLMRFYGYSVDEIAPSEMPNLDLDIDPKLSWALRNRADFPVDVNKAPKEILLRIPGIGVRSVNRILQIRRWSVLKLEDLRKLGISLKKCLPFLIAADHNPIRLGLDGDRLRESLAPPPSQLELDFGSAQTSARTGEV